MTGLGRRPPIHDRANDLVFLAVVGRESDRDVGACVLDGQHASHYPAGGEQNRIGLDVLGGWRVGVDRPRQPVSALLMNRLGAVLHHDHIP